MPKTTVPDVTDDTLAKSPRDPVTGQVRPHPKPGERPGTEAQEAEEGSSPPKPPGEGPPAGQRNDATPRSVG